MLQITIPGRGRLELKHVVLDFNGTFALDGTVLPGVVERLNRLAESLELHIFTADTFGTAREACAAINGVIKVVSQEVVGPEKEWYVKELGAANTVAIGNGANDRLMLRRAVLGILVLGPEGTAAEAFDAADIVVKDINDGLDLLLNPKRLAATLRR
ncbi:MAG TPA: ATPase P [Desulfotomaculum sp.]|nr:ATPase P [Desulfotomaculum sp.]